MNKNDVSSFYYYMWNAWGKEECAIAFKDAACGWMHLWDKFSLYYNRFKDYDAAIGSFYANLSEDNQDLLVKRATELYNRKQCIK